MRFRRFKNYIIGEKFASSIFALVGVAFLFNGFSKEGAEMILVTCEVIAIMWSMIFAGCLTSDTFLLDTGDSLSDDIVLNEKGIRCVRVKAEDQFMPWDSVFSVSVLTDRVRGDRIEVRDCSGRQMIWWQYNRAATAYIRREHPELSLTDEWGHRPNKRWKI